MWIFWGQSYSTCEREPEIRDLAGDRHSTPPIGSQNACRTPRICSLSSSIHIRKVRAQQISRFGEIDETVPKLPKSAIFDPKTVSDRLEPFRTPLYSSDPQNTRNVSPSIRSISLVRVFVRKNPRVALFRPGCALVPQVEKNGKSLKKGEQIFFSSKSTGVKICIDQFDHGDNEYVVRFPVR